MLNNGERTPGFEQESANGTITFAPTGFPRKAQGAGLQGSDSACRKPVGSQGREAPDPNEHKSGLPFSLPESPASEIDWPSAPRHERSAILTQLKNPQRRGLTAAIVLFAVMAFTLFRLNSANARLERELAAAQRELGALRGKNEIYQKSLQAKERRLSAMEKEQGESYGKILALEHVIAWLREELDEADNSSVGATHLLPSLTAQPFAAPLD